MSSDAGLWTCPFCPLLCDGFAVEVAAGQPLSLRGSECPRGRAGLALFDAAPLVAAQPSLGGVVCDLDTAIVASAALLGKSYQPLFGGLGTDVAGARALYALAEATGAISDHAEGAELMHAVRAAQDRGGYSTTLAEVRSRADLVVCIGGLPTERHPEFLRRMALLPGDPRLALIGASVVAADEGAGAGSGAVTGADREVDSGPLFDTVARLAALVEERSGVGAAPELTALAERLRAAKYAVLVYETARLPRHGALIIEMIQRIVATLNRHTRAAALALGGGGGAATVNESFTWLSGLPLRQRVGPFGLEHEPVLYDAARLIKDGAVDLLLWVSSFSVAPCPPGDGLPRIVIGHPALAHGGAEVFIPVTTPGIGSAGHLFRTDGGVLLPLHALRADGLPTLAEVLGRIVRAMRSQHLPEAA